MFEPFSLSLGGGRRSDRHGVTERHPTLALPGPFLDPREIPRQALRCGLCAQRDAGPHRALKCWRQLRCGLSEDATATVRRQLP